MNWRSLVEKTKTLTEKSKPLIEQAKKYGSSAIEFAGKQVEQTPIFLKTEEEYNIHASEKRSICIAYNNTDSLSESIRIMMPIWTTQAWTDTAALKYIEISGNTDLSNNLGITGPLEMRVSYMGEEQYRLNNLEEIKKWWKDRTYTKNTISTEAQNIQTTEDTDESTDPLAKAETKVTTPRKKKSIAQ